MALVGVRRGVKSSLRAHLLSYWPLSEAGTDNRANLAPTSVGDLVPTGAIATQTGKVYAAAGDWPDDESQAEYLSLAHADKGELHTSVGVDQSRTIAFWMYCYHGSDTAAQYKAIFENGGNMWAGYGGEYVRINQEPVVFLTVGDGVGHGVMIHGPAIVTNSWELWFAVQDAELDVIRLFKIPASGVEVGDSRDDGTWVYGQCTNPNPIKVCAPYTNGNAQHRLGPLMVFDKALSADERAWLWNGGAGRSYAELA